MTSMRSRIVSLAIVLTVMAAGAPLLAQPEQPRLNVPESGEVDLKTIPRMGEEVRGALMTSRVDQDPLALYFGNTRVCAVTGLWECHTWYASDGTGVAFYARKKPDGSVELGSTEFSYRVTGKKGDYHLCRTPKGGQEMCSQQKWDRSHYLYDEWFVNYDRPAEASYPAYKNVHEDFAIIAGHR